MPWACSLAPCSCGIVRGRGNENVVAVGARRRSDWRGTRTVRAGRERGGRATGARAAAAEEKGGGGARGARCAYRTEARPRCGSQASGRGGGDMRTLLLMLAIATPTALQGRWTFWLPAEEEATYRRVSHGGRYEIGRAHV